MALILQTAKRKTGEYEGRRYDNVYLYAFDPDSKNEQLIFGPDVETIKMKYEDFCNAIARNVAALSYVNTAKDAEGLFIIPVYNKFGNCTDFTLSDGGAPKKA